ncbi:Glyoxalase-like domain-containing protein [Monaibacterium marinum]|uniref:Glyoxalase-like domain-containing protein n=1 Tax=Pontivivens marinum TaxID=1690039 RepID=A0A2C9CPX7_9RHOB|nr:VOC family protein [Monaibacterium marinum]SOH93406.1 Glyoxalase-like domain-containing protein [Monaibacterium marinum]
MQIDHLVFAAADLQTGREWMTRMLGVPPGGAGQHPLMGTHNALWSLGDCYLEVIAVDPAVTAQRTRWFGLDDPAVQKSLADGPRLLTWVARVNDLHQRLHEIALPVGPAVRVTRAGLHWDLSVRDDGALLQGGRVPTLIEWPADVVTPEISLPDGGVSLENIAISDASAPLLTAVADVPKVQHIASGPALRATFATPRGSVTLTS